MVTQDDIARQLNISRTTVARALNGQSVSAGTKARVIKKAQELGYEKNTAAASLALKEAKTVYAFIMATIDEGYGQQTADGILEAAHMWTGYNFEIKIVSTDISVGKNQDRYQMEQFFEVINKEKVDGIIFSALSQTNVDWVSQICGRKGIPLMTLDCLYTNHTLCHIGPDYFNLGTYSAALLASLIMNRGEILTLCYDEGYYLERRRMEGFFDKLRQYPGIHLKNVMLDEISPQCYHQVLMNECKASWPKAIYAPYHVDYIGDFLNEHNMQHNVVTISNGINDTIEKYLFDGTVEAVVSARPYFLGAVAANNFFKYFYRKDGLLTGNIDVACDIYIKENYNRYDKIF